MDKGSGRGLQRLRFLGYKKRRKRKSTIYTVGSGGIV
jgi:hypothetical protein